MLPESISLEAAHLINCMIQVNASERINLQEALKHPWIQDEPLTDEKEIKILIEKKENVYNIFQTCNSVSGTTIRNTIAPLKTNHLMLSNETSTKNIENQSTFNFRSTSSRFHNKYKTEKMNSMKELPTLMTKVPGDFKESSMYEYNFSLMRQFGGKIPNFMQPIGHNKTQKSKINKIKDFMKQYFELLNPEYKNNEDDHQLTTSRKHTDVSKNSASNIKNYKIIEKNNNNSNHVPNFNDVGQGTKSNLKHLHIPKSRIIPYRLIHKSIDKNKSPLPLYKLEKREKLEKLIRSDKSDKLSEKKLMDQLEERSQERIIIKSPLKQIKISNSLQFEAKKLVFEKSGSNIATPRNFPNREMITVNHAKHDNYIYGNNKILNESYR